YAATIYSNSIGVDFDLRKNGGSTIPWIQYADYNTGDILFFQKGQQNSDAFHSVINSSLKAVYIGVDELWSTNLVQNKLDFEYGFGVGIGFLFGHLVNDWVSQDPTGDYRATDSTSPPAPARRTTSMAAIPGATPIPT